MSGCFVGNHFILSEKPPQSNNMYMGKRPFLFSRIRQTGPMHPSPGNGKRPCQSARRNPPGKFRATGADSKENIPLRFEGPSALPELRRTKADSTETSSTGKPPAIPEFPDTGTDFTETSPADLKVPMRPDPGDFSPFRHFCQNRKVSTFTYLRNI